MHVQDPEGKCATPARLALQETALESQSNHAFLQWFVIRYRTIEEGRKTTAIRLIPDGNLGVFLDRGPFARDDIDRRCLYQAQQRPVDDRATPPTTHLRLTFAVPR